MFADLFALLALRLRRYRRASELARSASVRNLDALTYSRLEYSIDNQISIQTYF